MSKQYQPPKYEPLDISQFQQQQQQQSPPQQQSFTTQNNNYNNQERSIQTPKYEPLDISQFQQPPTQQYQPSQQAQQPPQPQHPQQSNFNYQSSQQNKSSQPPKYEPVNFLPQRPNQFELPPGIRDNNYNNDYKTSKDFEYRDSINEKVNDLKFSLPTQSKAQHYFDQSLIDNNPRYMNFNKNDINQSKRDSRDGMNNKMDGFMFQQFNNNNNNVSFFSNQPQNTHQNQNQTQQQYHNNIPSTNTNFMTNLPSNFNNVFQQTSRINNKDLNNERMQTISSLPRALNQPMQLIDNRIASSSFTASYQDQYKPFSPNMDPTIYNKQFNNYQQQNQQNQQHNQSNQTMVLQDEAFLRKNESSRSNNKDTYNQRMQYLIPLPRTAAIPITTSDYNKSIQQNIQLMANSKNYKQSDMDTRHEVAEHRKQEWERMSNNINLFGNPNKIIVDLHRPMDTRQY
jgi:hypothetical protein